MAHLLIMIITSQLCINLNSDFQIPQAWRKTGGLPGKGGGKVGEDVAVASTSAKTALRIRLYVLRKGFPFLKTNMTLERHHF